MSDDKTIFYEMKVMAFVLMTHYINDEEQDVNDRHRPSGRMINVAPVSLNGLSATVTFRLLACPPAPDEGGGG